ncbi:hypothetical protein JOD54_000850 [Actinokineospora baliensis]|nr:hypothetical protein [Actinokineospora baliensis]
MASRRRLLGRTMILSRLRGSGRSRVRSLATGGMASRRRITRLCRRRRRGKRLSRSLASGGTVSRRRWLGCRSSWPQRTTSPCRRSRARSLVCRGMVSLRRWLGGTASLSRRRRWGSGRSRARSLASGSMASLRHWLRCRGRWLGRSSLVPGRTPLRGSPLPRRTTGPCNCNRSCRPSWSPHRSATSLGRRTQIPCRPPRRARPSPVRGLSSRHSRMTPWRSGSSPTPSRKPRRRFRRPPWSSAGRFRSVSHAPPIRCRLWSVAGWGEGRRRRRTRSRGVRSPLPGLVGRRGLSHLNPARTRLSPAPGRSAVRPGGTLLPGSPAGRTRSPPTVASPVGRTPSRRSPVCGRARSRCRPVCAPVRTPCPRVSTPDSSPGGRCPTPVPPT